MQMHLRKFFRVNSLLQMLGMVAICSAFMAVLLHVTGGVFRGVGWVGAIAMAFMVGGGLLLWFDHERRSLGKINLFKHLVRSALTLVALYGIWMIIVIGRTTGE